MRLGVVGHRGYDRLPDVLGTLSRLAPALGLELRGLIDSPVTGAGGNREALAWLRKPGTDEVTS